MENAENNSDELGLGGEDEEEAAEENPADLKAAMDELPDRNSSPSSSDSDARVFP